MNEGGYDDAFMAPNDALSKRLFNHISLTGPDSAWIATEEGGLFHFTNGGFVDYGDATPLADQTVYLVEALDWDLVAEVPGLADSLAATNARESTKRVDADQAAALKAMSG